MYPFSFIVSVIFVCVLFTKSLHTLISWRYSLMFSSRRFIVFSSLSFYHTFGFMHPLKQSRYKTVPSPQRFFLLSFNNPIPFILLPSTSLTLDNDNFFSPSLKCYHFENCYINRLIQLINFEVVFSHFNSLERNPNCFINSLFLFIAR